MPKVDIWFPSSNKCHNCDALNKADKARQYCHRLKTARIAAVRNIVRRRYVKTFRISPSMLWAMSIRIYEKLGYRREGSIFEVKAKW